MEDEFIERRILTGAIVSNEYLDYLATCYQQEYIESGTCRVLLSWVFEFHKKYNKAPKTDIQGIYQNKLKTTNLTQEKAEDIEDILEDLSEEFEHTVFNHRYLIDQTIVYFKERNIKSWLEDVNGAVLNGDLEEAERLSSHYQAPVGQGMHIGVDPFSDVDLIKDAFAQTATPVITFPGELGKFINPQLTRDSFVVFMGPEKRGKTFLLMEVGLRALMSGCNVAFFGAGDMTQNQMIRRIGIYLCGKSDMEEYCGELWKPCVDCRHNQFNTCERKERKCDFGLFTETTNEDENEEIGTKKKKKKKEVTFEMLKKELEGEEDYVPCYHCKDKFIPSPSLKKVSGTVPITWKDVWKETLKFRKKYDKRFKLACYSNNTLSVSEMSKTLDIWERQDGFVPDVIVVDYADILINNVYSNTSDFRHSTNEIWQNLRSLSQARHCLLVSATQAAATSYNKYLMGRVDFSEDKRKIAHVTAMYGLNQTDAEKQIGILRLNEIAKREGSYSEYNQVAMLQRLEMGKPYLGSYKVKKGV